MRTTKKTLTLSILSVLLCVAMLVGTTFAWFSDSVTSGANKIVAGNLDIEVEYSKDGSEWTAVEGKFGLFADVSLWEPGAASVVYLRITNKGTLALKYSLAVTASGGEFTNKAGETRNLKDALKFAQVASSALVKYETREDAVAATAHAAVGLSDYVQSGRMIADEISYLTLVVTMPADIGDEFNYKTGTPAPEIELSITLNATQYTFESDSFDNQYDASAPWLGATDTEGLAANTDSDAKTVTIETAEQLAAFAANVNSKTCNYSGYTVEIVNDIDLNGKLWTPIDLWFNDMGYALTIDGRGHSIKNMVITSDEQKLGFIKGTASSVIVMKDLTFVNPKITSKGPGIIGVVIGGMYGNVTLNNVDVTGAVITGSMASKTIRLGGLIGQVYLGEGSVTLNMNGCDVTDSTIKGFHNVGGLIGTVNNAATHLGNITAADCSVKNCTLCGGDTRTAAALAGCVHEVACNSYDNVIIPNVTTENVTVSVEPVPGVLFANDIYSISSAEGLVWLSETVNAGNRFLGKTVKLANDIDLAGIAWIPIGGDTMASYPGITFEGTFDGQNHTVTNLKTSSDAPVYACAGLFGTINTPGKILNVNLENVDIKSTHYAGAVVAYASKEGEINNCHVNGGTITSEFELVNGQYDNGDKVGGIAGYGIKKIDNCSVEGVTITGYRDVGGIAGYSDGATVTNNIVKDVVLMNNRTHNYKNYSEDVEFDVKEIIGEATDSTTVSGNSAINVTIGRMVPVSVPENATPEQTQTAVNNAVAAASAGDVIVIPNTDAGVKLPAVASGVTLKGDGTTKIDATAALPNINGATLDGFVMECGQSNYHGFTHSDAVIRNCTIKGLLFSYNAGGEQVFENCTFINDKESGEYNMWAYGAVSYKNCTFKSYGKFVNVYNEGTAHFDVNFEGCTFINLKATANKSGINVKDTSGSNQLNITVNISDCTYEGVAPVVETTTTLHRYNPVVQLDDIGAGPSNIIIIQDNVTLWPEN